MAEITKEQLLEFIRNKDLDLDESYPRSDWWKFRDERDSYKKQRDELINDMAEIKKKAEAFDEILEITEEDCWAEDFAVYISQVIDKYKEVDHEG
ncbi:hypothetical protein AB0Q58_01675 [Staphylococcus epidermidis]|uniref:hypothetical protein n=1 Tax=Staphylococcus epidermidis TaxID=1282 RepID=UPI003459C48F